MYIHPPPLYVWTLIFFISGFWGFRKKRQEKKYTDHNAKFPLLFTSTLGSSTDWTLLLCVTLWSHAKRRRLFKRVQVELCHFWVYFIIEEPTAGQILISVTPKQICINATDHSKCTAVVTKIRIWLQMIQPLLSVNTCTEHVINIKLMYSPSAFNRPNQMLKVKPVHKGLQNCGLVPMALRTLVNASEITLLVF